MDAPSLKGLLRAAAVSALVLGALTGTLSATETMELSGLERADWAEHPPAPLLGDPTLARHVLEAQLAALEPMRTSRGLLLSALAIACALVSISSIRLLRPRGLPRTAVRRLLSVVCLIAAGLRTVVGAQGAVVARQVGLAVAPVLATLSEAHDPAVLEQLRQATPGFLMTLSALWTALVAGLFLLLGQYFRSDRVREALGGRSEG